MTHIIIDEIHERSCLVDFILIILRRLLRKNLQLRVVLMSATVEAGMFAQYFGDDCPAMTIPGFTFPVNVLYAEDAVTMAKYNPQHDGPQQPRHSDNGRGGRGRGGGGARGRGRGRGGRERAAAAGKPEADVPDDVVVEGGTDWSDYPPRTQLMIKQIDGDTNADKIEYGLVEALLLHIEAAASKAHGVGKSAAADGGDGDDDWETVGETVSASREILDEDRTAEALRHGSVLVFLPGIAEITKLASRLQGNGTFKKWHVVPLHSSLPARDQRQIFLPPPKGMRKVVLATNIAETSITIEDCTIVIDCGRVKEMRYDANRRMGILEQVCFLAHHDFRVLISSCGLPCRCGPLKQALHREAGGQDELEKGCAFDCTREIAMLRCARTRLRKSRGCLSKTLFYRREYNSNCRCYFHRADNDSWH